MAVRHTPRIQGSLMIAQNLVLCLHVKGSIYLMQIHYSFTCLKTFSSTVSQSFHYMKKKNLKTQLIHLAPRNIFDFDYIRSFGKLQLSNKNIKHAYGAVTILFDSLDIIGGRVTFYCCRSA